MKRIPALALVLGLLASATLAQATTHSVALSWTAGGDATTATTYHVYRATSGCVSGVAVSTLTLSFVRLDGVSSAISATNYTDTTVGVGAFCYYVTAVLNGAESNPSLTAGANVLPSSPATLKAVAN